MNTNGIYIDLMLTHRCNFRCKYCFEHDYCYQGDISEEVSNKVIPFSNMMYEYYKNRGRLNICYWGGEPSLRMDKVDYFTNELRNFCDFAIFTNGFTFEKIRDQILEYHNRGINFFTQISYDYSPNQEKNRICLGYEKNKDFVKDKILNAIYWSAEKNIDFSTKSTIKVEDLDKIYDVYLDFMNVRENVIKINPEKRLSLALTLDTSNMPPKEELERVLNKFREGLSNIIAYSLNRHEYPYINWLSDCGKALCSVGYNMITVDIDGYMYPCHGSIYSSDFDKLLHRKKQTIFTVTKEDIPSLFREKMYSESDECKKCDACFCMRCNVNSFGRSKKETYDERMMDFATDEQYCRIYKEVSKFVYALRKIKRNNCATC